MERSTYLNHIRSLYPEPCGTAYYAGLGYNLLHNLQKIINSIAQHITPFVQENYISTHHFDGLSKHLQNPNRDSPSFALLPPEEGRPSLLSESLILRNATRSPLRKTKDVRFIKKRQETLLALKFYQTARERTNFYLSHQPHSRQLARELLIEYYTLPEWREIGLDDDYSTTIRFTLPEAFDRDTRYEVLTSETRRFKTTLHQTHTFFQNGNVVGLIFLNCVAKPSQEMEEHLSHITTLFLEKLIQSDHCTLEKTQFFSESEKKYCQNTLYIITRHINQFLENSTDLSLPDTTLNQKIKDSFKKSFKKLTAPSSYTPPPKHRELIPVVLKNRAFPMFNPIAKAMPLQNTSRVTILNDDSDDACTNEPTRNCEHLIERFQERHSIGITPKHVTALHLMIAEQMKNYAGPSKKFVFIRNQGTSCVIGISLKDMMIREFKNHAKDNAYFFYFICDYDGFPYTVLQENGYLQSLYQNIKKDYGTGKHIPRPKTTQSLQDITKYHETRRMVITDILYNRFKITLTKDEENDLLSHNYTRKHCIPVYRHPKLITSNSYHLTTIQDRQVILIVKNDYVISIRKPNDIKFNFPDSAFLNARKRHISAMIRKSMHNVSFS